MYDLCHSSPYKQFMGDGQHSSDEARFSGTSSCCLRCFTYLRMEARRQEMLCPYGFGHSCIQNISLDGTLVWPSTSFFQDKVQAAKDKVCVEWVQLMISSPVDFWESSLLDWVDSGDSWTRICQESLYNEVRLCAFWWVEIQQVTLPSGAKR